MRTYARIHERRREAEWSSGGYTLWVYLGSRNINREPSGSVYPSLFSPLPFVASSSIRCSFCFLLFRLLSLLYPSPHCLFSLSSPPLSLSFTHTHAQSLLPQDAEMKHLWSLAPLDEVSEPQEASPHLCLIYASTPTHRKFIGPSNAWTEKELGAGFTQLLFTAELGEPKTCPGNSRHSIQMLNE